MGFNVSAHPHLAIAFIFAFVVSRCRGFFAGGRPLRKLSSLAPAAINAQFQTNDDLPFSETAFDSTVMSRYACSRYQRYDGNMTSMTTASPSNPLVVQKALDCLDLARRAPSGFNAQPYKLILVHSVEGKIALARHCCGRNAHRVRDSDCTAIFLSDREVCRTWGSFKQLLQTQDSGGAMGKKRGLRKMQVFVALFSSGYPIPRVLAAPFSFLVRLSMHTLSLIVGRFYPLPSLQSAETWSCKNTMLVAMTYMLGCASRGLATTPMEGYNAGGIRSALGIPRRYSIPLIVTTGHPYKRSSDAAKASKEETDDVGIAHGPFHAGSKSATPRYPTEEIVYDNTFGTTMKLSPSGMAN